MFVQVGSTVGQVSAALMVGSYSSLHELRGEGASLIKRLCSACNALLTKIYATSDPAVVR